MERVVQIFIEGERLELFKDEQISLNSSVQNIQDLSKVFTDFTQSFSVPTSPQNNQILKHFYANEIDFINGTFTNPQVRRFATIEIDSTPFKTGRMSLDKANLKNGKPYSYSLTFYGDLVSLKDTFGETRLMDLDWGTITFPYTLAEVKARIEPSATDYDIRYPLISSSRYWQYNNPQTPDENINTSASAIDIKELFPAVKNKAIIDVIEANFGITFQGAFLQDKRFTNSFLHFKNAVNFGYQTPPEPVEFVSLTSQGGTTLAPPWPYVFNNNTNWVNGGFITFDDTDNSIALQYVTYEYEEQIPFPPPPQIIDTGFHRIFGSFTGLSQQATIFIDVYTAPTNSTNYTFNGTVEVANAFPNGFTAQLYVLTNTNNPSIDTKVRFETRTDVPITFNTSLEYDFSGITGQVGNLDITCAGGSSLQEVDISALAPNISVQDYLSNLLKMFNLTAFGIRENVYEIATLEDWYNEGAIYDITQYTDTTSIDISRVPLYNKINFKYAECKSLTNRFFANAFLREYGDLYESFNYDGGEYTIELIFENILFSKFNNTELQVAYCLDEGLTPYIPAPIQLYNYDEKPCSFYITDGVTTSEVTSYIPMGQETNIINQDYSINWGTEISSLLGDTPDISPLYQEYYQAYLDNLYNPKNRITSLKAILPLDILTSLKLNDRVVIRDKRYVINTLTTNLTTGEVSLVLINDFRRMIADEVPPIKPPITPGPDAQCIDVWIPFVKQAIQCDVSQCGSVIPGVTITPTTLTEPGYVEICIPEDNSALTYIGTENTFIIPLITETGNDNLVTESSVEEPQVIVICLSYTLSNGQNVSNQIFIQRP